MFIITNIPPEEQYVNIDRETRQAFFRRIHIVREFEDSGRVTDYPGVHAYIYRHDWADQAAREPVQMMF